MSAKCPKCGCGITRADAKCPQCGVLLKWVKKPEQKRQEDEKSADKPGAGARFCPGCGSKLDEGQKFCPQCGTPAGGRKAGPRPVRVARNMAEARKYYESVRMGQEIEKQAQEIDLDHFSGCLIDPVFGGLPMIIASFFWHELYVFLGIVIGFGIASKCCRAAVRSRLAAHDVAGAKAVLLPAKVCFWIAVTALGAGLLDVVIRLMALANK